MNRAADVAPFKINFLGIFRCVHGRRREIVFHAIEDTQPRLCVEVMKRLCILCPIIYANAEWANNL